MTGIAVVPAAEADVPALRGLFRDYADWLQVDYCLKDFEAELAALPGPCTPPSGGLWVGRDGADLAGMVGMQPLPGGGAACEMKRLWVCPACRGQALGRRLAEAAMAGARAAGYNRMVLETLDFMTAARTLYADLGFHAVDRGDAPANVHRLECDLTVLATA